MVSVQSVFSQSVLREEGISNAKDEGEGERELWWCATSSATVHVAELLLVVVVVLWR